MTNIQIVKTRWTMNEIVEWAFAKALQERDDYSAMMSDHIAASKAENGAQPVGKSEPTVTLSVAAHDKLVSQIKNQQDTIREQDDLYASSIDAIEKLYRSNSGLADNLKLAQSTVREKEKLVSEVRAKNIELERANRKLRAQVDYITSMGYRLPEVLGE